MPRFRLLPALPALLMAAAVVPLAGQEAGSRWSLRFALGRDALAGASSDTISVPGTAVDVGPAPRWAIELGLARRIGRWEVALTGGYAGGALRVRAGDITIDDHTGSVRRYRGALTLGREVARLESTGLFIEAGPVLDRWETSAIGDRTVVGARGTLRLRIPLGPVALENYAGFTLSPGPFSRDQVPPGVVLESLRTWSLGAALRVGL